MAFRKRKAFELPESPRFLVIETGLIGELLAVTPVLRAIRKAYPSADVTVMVRPGSAPVLVGSPYVNKLLPLVSRERKGFWGVMRLASWVRSRNFDAALVLHAFFRSALISLMGAVPIRAGVSSEGRGFILTHKKPHDGSAYRVDEHLAVLELLGIPPDGPELEIFLTEEERRFAHTLLSSAAESRPLVGIHPGAGRANRRWPIRLFSELAARLERDEGVTPVFFVGPREEDLAHALGEIAEWENLPRPLVLRPGNVRILAAAFEMMDAVVTNNTGPMHVAAAVKTPGVFISGPTPVERWHPPGPLNTPVFNASVECRPCDLTRCSLDRLECLEEVSVDSVLEAVLGHLSKLSSSVAHRSGGDRT